MSLSITIKESDYNSILSEVIFSKKLNENLLDNLNELFSFQKKLFNAILVSEGNNLRFEIIKNEYFKKLFPNNKSIIKEYNKKVKHNLLLESTGSNNIDFFFDFLKQNILEQTKPVKQVSQKIKNLSQSLINAIGGAGTNEELVVSTIKQLSSKQEIFDLDSEIKSKTGQSLKDYINNDLTDFDSKEYREVWGHLGKFGVTGANYNNFLASVGKVTKSIGKGLQWLKENGINVFMDKIREFLDSGWGAAAQVFLDSFGIGAIGVAFVWGFMVVWDLINVNTLGYGRLFMSIISLLTAGAIAPFLGPVARIVNSVKGGLKEVLTKLVSSKIGQSFIAWIPKILSGVSSSFGWISKGVNWLLTKFKNYIPANISSLIQTGIQSAKKNIEGFSSDLVLVMEGKLTKKLVTDTIVVSGKKIPSVSSLLIKPNWSKVVGGLDSATAKLVDEYVIKFAKSQTWDEIERVVCQNYQSACSTIQAIGDTYYLKQKGEKYLKKITKK